MILSRYHAAMTVLVVLMSFGCEKPPTAPAATAPSQADGNVTTAQTAPPRSDAMSGTSTSGGGTSGAKDAPMMSGGSMRKLSLPQAVAEASRTDKSLVPLDRAYQAADKALKSSPADPAVKKAYVEAAYNFGHGAEYSDTLESMVKYRAALFLYRKALSVDPGHQPSLDEKNRIDDVYRTMPGGIPQ